MLKYPVSINQIKKFEMLNNLSISVFGWCSDDESDIPLKNGLGIGQVIDLLMIEGEEYGHYVLIKNFNAFMRHKTKYHHTMFYCRKCLHGFVDENHQIQHSLLCTQGVNQIISMPKPGVVEFKATHKQEKKQFVVYFDFECLTLRQEGCELNPAKSSTMTLQQHVPCSYCIMTKSEFSDYKEETIVFSHSDPNKVTEQFLEDLATIHDNMMKCYKLHQYPIKMSSEDEAIFKKSTHCHICKKKLLWGSTTNYPVRDHDHLKKENNFRGAACNVCNMNYFNRSKKVPAFAHNLKGYDLNLFLRDLARTSDSISVIPETIEKFKAVFTENFTFLDSFAFMSSSLDKLARNLKTEGTDKFKRLKKEFPKFFDLMLEKGIYFYDYACDFAIFSETEMPQKSDFFSILQEQDISDNDYSRAKHVYKVTGCKTLLDYMEIYVKQDTAILCDVFESFRELCINFYELDCCHYISLPSFAWDAMLKKTNVQLEYITDIDIYTFLENNLRCGVTTVNHRYFKANNAYLDDYNSSLPTSFLQYYDANNLYGNCLCMKMPTKNFRWLPENKVKSFPISKTDSEGDTFFALEVDLEYPVEIHDWHNDFPLAVEKKKIFKNQLSLFNSEFLDKRGEQFISSTKLVPDLNGKKNYVCSLKNLQLFLEQGLIVTKIHKILAADQSNFAKSYIDFNSEKRQEAKSDFGRQFFKDANNIIFGKFIESVRKRTNVDIVKDPKKAKKLISRPQYKGFQMLDEEITIVQSQKKIIKLDKPIACGFSVLENAKYTMGDFWYNVLKPKYGERIKLILSDTDSFIYGVYTNDAYEDMYQIRHLLDLSGYNQNTPLGKFYDSSNRKVPGKFSDEKPQEIIREVIALKPKMYSLLTKKNDL